MNTRLETATTAEATTEQPYPINDSANLRPTVRPPEPTSRLIVMTNFSFLFIFVLLVVDEGISLFNNHTDCVVIDTDVTTEVTQDG